MSLLSIDDQVLSKKNHNFIILKLYKYDKISLKWNKLYKLIYQTIIIMIIFNVKKVQYFSHVER